MKTRRCATCHARKPKKALRPCQGKEEVFLICQNDRACSARLTRGGATFYRRILGRAPVRDKRCKEHLLAQCRIEGKYS